MPPRVPSLLFALVLGASEAHAAAALSIALREELATDRLEYTLGEIATLRSADAALVARLRGLPIGRAPRVGYTNAVTRSAIEAQLERAVPGVHRRTHWSGPVATNVRGVGRAVSVEAHVERARQHLDAWLAAFASERDIELVEPGRDVRLPAGRLEVTPRLASGAPLRKRMCVWLDFVVDGTAYTRVPVWFEVSAFRAVPTATRDLAPGIALAPGDAVMRRSDLAAAGGTPLADLEAIAGQRVKRFVPVGAALLEEAVEPLPAIAQGDRVVVVAESGRVRIESVAIALEDGGRGETIRVRPQHGKKPYRVLVTGPRHATVGGDHD